MSTYFEVIGGEFFSFQEKKFNVNDDNLDLIDKIYLFIKINLDE